MVIFGVGFEKQHIIICKEKMGYGKGFPWYLATMDETTFFVLDKRGKTFGINNKEVGG